MRAVAKLLVVVLAVGLVATAADAEGRRKRERERERDHPAAPAPPDKRDRLVAAPGTPFNNRPYWVALAQCGGIYFKLNSLYSLAAIQTKVVKPDPSANAQFTKKSDAARRTATTFFEASERFLVADRGIAREEAMLTYDGRATEEGERYKSIDAAEQATKPCPALYQACRDVAPKICSQTSAADLKFLHHLRQAGLGTSNRKAALENHMLAGAPLLPKFVSNGAARYHELRKRGTSVAALPPRPNRKLAADQPAWHSQPTTPP